jgi:hypothetical protein
MTNPLEDAELDFGGVVVGYERYLLLNNFIPIDLKYIRKIKPYSEN